VIDNRFATSTVEQMTNTFLEDYAMEQRTNNENPTIINAGSPHMAVLFLLDTSASMQDEDRIGALNDGMNKFKEEIWYPFTAP